MGAIGKTGEALVWERWSEEDVLKLTDSRTGYKCEACGELPLTSVDNHLVQGENLGFVDSDCPCQFEGQLEM